MFCVNISQEFYMRDSNVPCLNNAHAFLKSRERERERERSSITMVKTLFQYTSDIPLHLGTLSRENALLCLRVKSQLDMLLGEHSEIIPDHEPKSVSLLLAVSGGIDSICMLAIFMALQKKYPITLHVAHLNHGIRAESEKEKVFVETLCKKFKLPFYYEKANIPQFAQESHMGLEEASRLKRYEFLEKIRTLTRASFICTAHHADDLAEDIFMRLSRGAAWPALGGMKELCQERKILRPLLKENKRELIRFAQELALPFANDESNEDQQFFRNRIRKQILPFFLSENPSFLENIKHLHEGAQRDRAFFQEQLDTFWQHITNENNKISMPLNALQNTHASLRFRIYTHAIKLLKGFTQYETLEKLDHAVMSNKGNSLFKFTQKARARIENKTLIFYS